MPAIYKNYTLSDGTSVLLAITHHPTSSEPAVVYNLCGMAVEKSALRGLMYFNTHRDSVKCQKVQCAKHNQTTRMET
jgi:hypothetical protein